MRKLNVAYVGNCSEEFSGVLDSFCGDMSTLTSVCDTDIKRALICVEKYLCNFVEDYREVIGRPEMDLVVIESCGQLRQSLIRQAVEAGKNIYVILDEQTLLQVGQVAEAVREAQDTKGVQAIFVTVDELDNDFWSNLPIGPEDLGRLLNVTIGLPSWAPGSVSLERNAYDAVRTVYELLGGPAACIGMQGSITEELYTGAATFRYAGGTLASVVIGGTVRSQTVHLFGEKGVALLEKDTIQYRLEDGPLVVMDITAQKRRTRKPTLRLLESLHGGQVQDHGHSLDEVLATSRMLRAVLCPTERE